MPSLLELFRVLASFSPASEPLRDAPWEAYVDWAIAQGLAPLAAYNLEYRLGRSGAPQWAKDRLLSIYQGTANDNVMKLVGFKRAVGELQGRRVVLFGSAAFADSLYPHVAFRPVGDLELFVAKMDLDPFASFLARSEFKLDQSVSGPTRVLSDGRTTVTLHSSLLGSPPDDDGLLMRALPVKVYGPSVRRLDLEDALLVQAHAFAHAGFEVPFIELVDLRELVSAVPSLGGPDGRPADATSLLLRARAVGAERALWVTLRLVERLFPETAAVIAPLMPPLPGPVGALLERLVVTPVAEVGRTTAFRGEDSLRALLAGG